MVSLDLSGVSLELDLGHQMVSLGQKMNHFVHQEYLEPRDLLVSLDLYVQVKVAEVQMALLAQILVLMALSKVGHLVAKIMKIIIMKIKLII